MELEEVRELVSGRGAELDILWRSWATAGPVLASPVPDGITIVDGEASS